MKKLSSFYWFGGKYPYIELLRSHIPIDAKHFIDVFGGSAVVILNVGPYKKETYNDKNPDVSTFFSVLKNKKDDIVRLLDLTPYSAEEFANACKSECEIPDVEVARRFYIRSMQSFMGRNSDLRPKNWAISINAYRHGVPNRIKSWLDIERLVLIYNRFKNINIENLDSLEIIEKYDDKDTVFYIDPPYISSVRSKNAKRMYGNYEMTDNDHKDLAKALNGIEGRAVVSGYKSTLYENIFNDWNRVDFNHMYSRSAKTSRQESVWKNF